MKYIARAFWGAVAAINLLAITLFITMYFEIYGVFWWLWNTTYAVLYVAAAGAMLGLSFDFVSQNSVKIKKHLAGTRAFHRLRITRSLAKLLHPVKQIREGKKWKTI